MKKYIGFFLIISTILFIVGCGSQPTVIDTENVQSNNTETTNIEDKNSNTATETITLQPENSDTIATDAITNKLDTENTQAIEENTAPLTIYLTRHGKTMLNTTDRVQGWADSPLTDAGIEVAQQLGKGLKASDIKFDGVYTSDSGRAIETANIIIAELGQKNLPIIESEKLREWNFGGFEGDLNANMTTAIEQDAGLENDPNTSVMVRLPMNELADHIAASDKTKTAENWDALSTRIDEGFQETVDTAIANHENTILIVVHGLTINTILKDIDPTFTTVQVPNAAVAKIIYENGQYTIETFNDTSYLKEN